MESAPELSPTQVPSMSKERTVHQLDVLEGRTGLIREKVELFLSLLVLFVVRLVQVLVLLDLIAIGHDTGHEFFLVVAIILRQMLAFDVIILRVRSSSVVVKVAIVAIHEAVTVKIRLFPR